MSAWKMHPSQSFRLPSTQSCVFCREGLHSSCVHVGYYGQIGASGLQAELARVPNADGSLVVVPGINPDTADDAMLASLLSLSDVYLTGYHAAHVGQVVPGKTVTVIGDGAVGLSALLASRSLGAERIILMGRHTDRTDLGIEFGATDVVAERGAEGVARVMDLTGGEGSHIVLEAVGLLPAYEQAYGIIRPGGIISRVGAPQYEDAIGQVLEGTINPGRVFDSIVTLDQAPEGYAAMNDRTALKVMLRA